MSPPLKSALGCTTTDEVHIFVFPDGRECVPAAVVERSSLLKGLLGESGDAIVKLPRAVFQLWAVCSKDCDPSLSTAALVQMIKVLVSHSHLCLWATVSYPRVQVVKSSLSLPSSLYTCIAALCTTLSSYAS